MRLILILRSWIDANDDDSYNDFTEGQKVRMHAMWNIARNPANLKGNGTIGSRFAAEKDRKITWPKRMKYI